MRKLIATAWLSLDGVFDATTMEQWFNPYHSDSRANSIQQTIHNCDAMLYGRKTYEMLYPYWSTLQNNEMGVAEKLNKVKKYLVSSTLQEGAWENTDVISGDMIEAISQIKNKKGGNILIQGSAMLVSSLLRAGLIDELQLLIQPHIAGSGATYFADDNNAGLCLIKSNTLENGVLELRYAKK